MLAVTFIVSSISVLGFYSYVFVQLLREQKRGDSHKKHLAEHLYEMESDPRQSDAENPEDPDFLSSGAGIRFGSIAGAMSHQEAIVRVGLTLGGLAAILGGIEFLNSLVGWLHWN